MFFLLCVHVCVSFVFLCVCFLGWADVVYFSCLGSFFRIKFNNSLGNIDFENF